MAKTEKRGRKPEPPPNPEERARVKALAAIGMSQEEIAIVMGYGEHRLSAHFAAELKTGAIEADGKVVANLFKAATMDPSIPGAVTAAIFWTKVRRRWHEVQRIIHGYDPEIVTNFVKQVVAVLRRDLPTRCPGCKTRLDMPEKVAGQLKELSQKMASQLPPSEIVPRPVEAPGSGG